MTTLKVKDVDGNDNELSFREGDNLMETLRAAGFEDEIQALCGGSCSCATCHVWVLSGLPGESAEIDDDEQELIELAEDYQVGKSRLSCQITLTQEMHDLHIQLIDTN